MHASLLDLVNTSLRSWWTVVAAISLGLAGGVLMLDYLPKKYEAQTIIWVSQQQLPESVARTTVSDEMSRRLVIFRAAVLKDEYMVELVKRTFGLPKDADALRGLNGTVRAKIGVAVNAPRRRGLIAFELTYKDVDPKRAALIVNTLAELYIAQHEEFRTGQAEQTAQTIESMATEAKSEFIDIDERFRSFKQRHYNETESFLDANRDRLAVSERELKAVQDQWNVADIRRQNLEMQLQMGRIPGGAAPRTSPGVVDPTSREIARLQGELAALLVHYSELHPDYIRKKLELEDLLSDTRSPAPTGQESGLPVDPGDAHAADLGTEITILEQTQDALKSEETRLRADIAEYNRRIRVAPTLQRELDELARSHELARDKYVQLERDAERAQGAVALEESEMGQRMEILEAAPIPVTPYFPQPLQVYVLCLVMSCGLFLGPVLARSFLRPVIVSEAGFGELSEVPVLSSIPTIQTDQVRKTRRGLTLKNVAFAALSCVILVGAKLYTIGL